MSRRTMHSGKARRAAYRRSIITRESRFDEMMAAAIGGGTAACASCCVVRPLKTLNQRRVCPACIKTMGRLRVGVPRAPIDVDYAESHVVWTDASFSDGTAGLAVVGALGEHARRIECVSSTQAEVLALRWAMEIARASGVKGLTFRTDCEAAWKLLRQTPKREYWSVEWVSRRHNQRADHLAGKARLEGWQSGNAAAC